MTSFVQQFVKSVISLSVLLVVTVSVYPWSGNYEQRNLEILNQLREQLQIDIISETIPQVFQQEPKEELVVRNLQGIPFSAKLKKDNPADFRSQYDYLFDERKLSAKLEGICSVLPIEYWNYEWCHRREFSQFHLEQEPRRIVKAPDWSLGKYTRTIVVRERGEVGNNNVPIVKLVDYYTGGQICHENNHLRSVEVHIQCCDNTGIPNAIPSEAYQSMDKASAPFPLAILNRIIEPELCSYQATVCSPLLCMKVPEDANRSSDASSPSKAPTASPVTKFQPSSVTGSHPAPITLNAPRPPPSHPRFTEIMKLINSTCLARQEEWWTYELCFHKGVRQVRFNIEQTVTAEGTVIQKQVLAAQFSLGEPDFSVYTDEAALIAATQDKLAATGTTATTEAVSKDLQSREREMVNTFGLVSPLFRARDKQPNSLSLEFTNGTACDLERVNRSVVIEMYCGLMNTIVSIREDSTCKYRMKVELNALCTLPGFAPVKDNVTSIILTPLYNPEEDGSASPPTTTTLEEEAEEGIDIAAIRAKAAVLANSLSSLDSSQVDKVFEVILNNNNNLENYLDLDLEEYDKYMDEMTEDEERFRDFETNETPAVREAAEEEAEVEVTVSAGNTVTNAEEEEANQTSPLPVPEGAVVTEEGSKNPPGFVDTVEEEREKNNPNNNNNRRNHQHEDRQPDDVHHVEEEEEETVEVMVDFEVEDEDTPLPEEREEEEDNEEDDNDDYSVEQLERNDAFADQLIEQLESILEEIENAEVIDGSITDSEMEDIQFITADTEVEEEEERRNKSEGIESNEEEMEEEQRREEL